MNAPFLPDGITVDVIDDGPGPITIDPVTGAVQIEHGDGSVTIDLAGNNPEEDGESEHFDDLSGKIAVDELGRIAEDLLRGIEADDTDRSEWLETRAEGIKLLGLALKKPGGDADTASESVSKIDHPLLLEAVLRFQANASAELLPAAGPVKVRDDKPASSKTGQNIGQNGGPPLDGAPEEATRDELAEALEKDLNHYLTVTAREYVPDTDRMLLLVGLGGCMFKKVYRCPLRRRPVSESIDVKDMIVSNAAVDLALAGRATHRIMMRPSMLRRMQLAGAYRDVELNVTPQPIPNAADAQQAETLGVAAVRSLPEDHDYTIYECYCELDIAGFEHVDDDGEITGLQVPYVVTIDKDSKQVLAVRRNFDEDDPFCLPINKFVKYPYVPGLGFYDIGLVHMLGNTTKAATAGWRVGLDAGMFANFPGFLYLASALKGGKNQFRVPPGGGAPVDAAVDDIGKAVMPLPYKEMGPSFSALLDSIIQTGQRIGGVAEIQVGEGRQDAPVGTTIALLEQSTKVEAAVHKRLHAAQSEEFQLLKAELRKDPSVLWRHRKSALAAHLGLTGAAAKAIDAEDPAQQEARDKIIKALDDFDLVPAADPNTPSHVHRLMKAIGIKQLASASPGLYDPKKVDKLILKTLGVDDPDDLFAPPAPPMGAPGPDPTKAAEIASKEDIEREKIAAKREADAAKFADNDKQRKADADLAVVDLARSLAVHPEAQPLIDQTLNRSI